MEVVLDASRLRKLRSLMLIYLLAVNAAADCPNPPTVQHETDLSPESRMVDVYSEGVQLQLVCVRGYDRKSGTGITTCSSGEWTKSDLVCIKKDCGPPKDQAHMKFNLSEGTLFGDSIRVLCDKGYYLSGVAYKQCLAFGWFGTSSCHAVVCKMPPEVANGSRSWDGVNNPKYGEIIQYSCDKGYTLIGNSSITCDENGGYTPGPPECKAIPTEAKIPTTLTSSTPRTSKAETISTVTSATSSSYRNKAASTISLSHEATSGFSKEASSSSSFREVPGINSNKEIETTSTVKSATSSSHINKFATTQAVSTLSASQELSVPVIISLTAVFLVIIVVIGFLYTLHQKKKGSYDTGEDLKPELLQCQNL